MPPLLDGLAGALAGLLYPVLCPGCDSAPAPPSSAADFPLCPACAADLAALSPVTPRLPDAAGIPVRAGGRYEGLLARAIRAFKLGGRDTLAGPLSALAAAACEPGDGGDREDLLLLHVPSAPRGDPPRDRAGMLASQTASRLGLPHWAGAFERLKEAGDQARLPRAERLSRALERLRPAHLPPAGARVLLFDDIITTGATLSVVARILGENGVVVTACLAVAATPGERCDDDA